MLTVGAWPAVDVPHTAAAACRELLTHAAGPWPRSGKTAGAAGKPSVLLWHAAGGRVL